MMDGVPPLLVVVAAACGGAVILRRPHIMLLAFAVLAPFGLVELQGGVDLVTLLALAVVLAAIWEHVLRGRLLARGLMPIAATVYTLSLLAALAFSDDPFQAAPSAAWQVLAAWFAVAVATLTTGTRRAATTTGAVLLGATAVAGSGLAGGMAPIGAYGGTVVEGRAQGIFAQPNEYGLYCAMFSVFAFGVLCLASGVLRVLAVLCTVASVAGLAASFSRASWLGAIAAAIALAAMVPQTRRPQAFSLLAGAAALGIVLVALPYWQLPQLLVSRFASIVSGEVNPYDNRGILLSEGLRQWAANPLFGVGPGTYPAEARRLESLTRTVEGEHAHNLAVTIGAEQGLLGLVALGVVCIAVVRAARRARAVVALCHRQESPVPAGATIAVSAAVALVAAFVAGVVDYPLRNPLLLYTTWLLVGMTVARLDTTRQGRPAPGAEHIDSDEHANAA